MKALQFLLTAIVAGAFGVSFDTLAQDRAVPPQIVAAAQLPVEGKFPALSGAIGWLNSAALTPAGLRGKVVLVSFWTYTCINWRRQFPYVRAWAEKYKDRGLVVIGVHTPEFPFEHDVDNVRQATMEIGVAYPIAIDSDYAVWNAFNNQYWPALYFFDAQGRLRHHYFGEGEYEQSERVIQQLLAENGIGNVDRGLVAVGARGLEAAPDWNDQMTAETYLGFGMAENFASPGGAVPDQRRAYGAPTKLKPNQWALSGDWTVGEHAAALNQPNGRIVLRFHARDVHLVMGPAKGGSAVRFRVTIDGQAPGQTHGSDVDAGGNGTATEQRLYQLIRQQKPISDRQFEIEFLDPGVEVYSFTFG